MIVLVMGLMLTTASCAQNQGRRGNLPPEVRAENMAARVAERLALDQPTQDSLAAIYLRSMQDLEVQSRERKTVMEAQQQEVKALLTPEQYTKYQAMVEKFRERRRSRGSL